MFAKRMVLACMSLVWLSAPGLAVAQTFLTSWGGYGSGDGELRTPQGVAVGGSGDVYVSDGDNLRVQVFSPNGTYLRQWALPPGEAGQDILGGQNIAVDANDNVYVGDGNKEKIHRYTSTGALLAEWDSPGGISLAVDASGDVYVTDRVNNRVVVYNNFGVYLRQLGSSGSGPGELSGPDGVAIDAAGNVCGGLAQLPH